MAYQHSCLNSPSYLCPRNRPGKPTTKRCPRCGGDWVVRQGRYALLEWRGDAQYTADAALSIWSTEAAAERHVTSPGTQCVRFLVGA